MPSQKKQFFDFLQGKVTAATSGTPLFKAQLRFTPFEYTDEENFGICLSNVVSDPAPGVTAMSEYDCRLIVTTYCRIQGERDNRQSAYEKAKELALEVARLIYEERSCDHVGQLVDDVDEQLSPGQKHAVNNLYVVLNRTGAEMPGLWRR